MAHLIGYSNKGSPDRILHTSINLFSASISVAWKQRPVYINKQQHSILSLKSKMVKD